MSHVVLDADARFDYRTASHALIASGTAAELLPVRNRLGWRDGEALWLVTDDGSRRVVSIRNCTDRRPIAGDMVVFATLSRLAMGQTVTAEVRP